MLKQVFTYWRANVTCYKNLRVTWFGNDKNILKCLRSNIRCDILRFLSTELKVYVDVLENFAVFFHVTDDRMLPCIIRAMQTVEVLG